MNTSMNRPADRRAQVRRHTVPVLSVIALVLAGLAAPSPATAAPTPPSPSMTPTNANPGQVLTVTGRLTPASPALTRPITPQILRGTTWTTATTGKTTVKGTYTLRTKAPSGAGTFSYRMTAKALTVKVKGKKKKLVACRVQWRL